MKRFGLLIIISCLTLSVVAGEETLKGNYTIEEKTSSIGFDIKRMKFQTIDGRFEHYDGTIYFDPDNIANSNVNITIHTDSINTDVKKRDKHLRSADFFDSQKFPDIIFTSNKVEKTDNGYIASGEFFMHGVTKEITLPFTIKTHPSEQDQSMDVTLETTLLRRDYNITWDSVLDSGNFVIGNEVKIHINLHAVKHLSAGDQAIAEQVLHE